MSECGSARGPPSCTRPSSACSCLAPRMCPSTLTIPTSGPARSSVRPASPRSSVTSWTSRPRHLARRAPRVPPARPGAARADRAASVRRRVDHLHLRLHWTAQGVAVSHRSAAGFVDAESRLFLQDRPIGVGDRVMAGLSVAFDASCEEMWLAWRYGACLVPAPRSLVRSGMDLGPWLVANGVTVVSTVPTLVALWPTHALDAVRLSCSAAKPARRRSAHGWPPPIGRSGTPMARRRPRWWPARPGSPGRGRCESAPARRVGPGGRRW